MIRWQLTKAFQARTVLCSLAAGQLALPTSIVTILAYICRPIQRAANISMLLYTGPSDDRTSGPGVRPLVCSFEAHPPSLGGARGRPPISDGTHDVFSSPRHRCPNGTAILRTYLRIRRLSFAILSAPVPTPCAGSLAGFEPASFCTCLILACASGCLRSKDKAPRRTVKHSPPVHLAVRCKTLRSPPAA